MSGSALALTLCAAALHAGWNVLLAGSRRPEVATTAVLGVGLALFVAPAVLTWDVEAAAVPYIVASSALELVYLVLLGAAYARAEMTVVYPVARGFAPVLVVLATALAGTHPSAASTLGAITVCVGVLVVRATSVRGAGLGLALAVTIAGYTLVDHEGVQHAAPIPYLLLVLLPVTVAATLRVLLRGESAALRDELGWRAVAAGSASFGAYALVLAALERAPAAAVAAVRETSIAIAVLLGALVLREPVGRRRAVGALCIAAGAALAAAG